MISGDTTVYTTQPTMPPTDGHGSHSLLSSGWQLLGMGSLYLERLHGKQHLVLKARSRVSGTDSYGIYFDVTVNPDARHARRANSDSSSTTALRAGQRSGSESVSAGHAIHRGLGDLGRCQRVYHTTYRSPNCRRRSLSAPGVLDRPDHGCDSGRRGPIRMELLAGLFAERRPKCLNHRHSGRRHSHIVNTQAHSLRRRPRNTHSSPAMQCFI